MTRLLTIALAHVPPADAGLASGIVNVSMQLSAALGLAVLGSISSGRTADLVAHWMPLDAALIDGFHASFVVAGVCVALGAAAAQVLLRAPAVARSTQAEGVLDMEAQGWRVDDAA